jgi:hypothetical protein
MNLEDPSLENPSLENPNLENPNLENRSLEDPSLAVDPCVRSGILPKHREFSPGIEAIVRRHLPAKLAKWRA